MPMSTHHTWVLGDVKFTDVRRVLSAFRALGWLWSEGIGASERLRAYYKASHAQRDMF